MTTARAMPSDFMAQSVSAMNGFQLRMPTYTGSSSSLGQQGALFEGQRGQRRPANQSVAVFDFFDHFRAEEDGRP